MPNVILTKECSDLIRSQADGPFRQTGRQLVDGSYEVPLEQETIDRLCEHQFPGESLSDTIIRIILTHSGLKN